MIVTPDTAHIIIESTGPETMVARPVPVQLIHAESTSLGLINTNMTSLADYSNVSEISLPSINSGNIDISL